MSTIDILIKSYKYRYIVKCNLLCSPTSRTHGTHELGHRMLSHFNPALWSFAVQVTSCITKRSFTPSGPLGSDDG